MKYAYTIIAGLNIIMVVLLTDNLSAAMLAGIFVILTGIMATVCDLADKIK